MRRITLFLFLITSCFYVLGQDSTLYEVDSNHIQAEADSLVSQDTVTHRSEVTYQDLGKKRKSSSHGLLFFIGLGTFLLFGILRLLYTKHIKELISILSRSTLGRMTSKESVWQNLMPRWLFLIIYFLAAGYIAGQIIAYFNFVKESDMTLWLWGTLIIFLAYIFKFLTIHAVALVFRFNKTAVSFFNHLSVVNQLLGLILLPVCGIIMLAPAKVTNIVLIAITVVLLMSLIFKLLISAGYIRNLPKVNYFHFILYLCTLEFIPLAVFARYVYNGIGA